MLFSPLDFRIAKNSNELAMMAAKDFAQRAQEAVLKKGFFTVALSGGSTPRYLFDILTMGPELGLYEAIPWPCIQIFWGDERYVSHDNPQSNFFMTREHLLAKVPIPARNIHPIPTDGDDPKADARRYEKILRAEFQLGDTDMPEFDLVYLGIGSDGHTASLFPQTDIVKKIIAGKVSPNQAVAGLWVEKFNMYRISLLPSIINRAHCVSFLIAGEDKAQVLKMITSGPYNPEQLPAQLICPASGKLIWFLDQPAAAEIGKKTSTF